MKKLYLVDVSSMFFRAYYAIRQMSRAAGMSTNAVYGFLSMTLKLIKDIKPDYMAFCFDRPEPSFRKDIYSDYKANRSEMPDDLIPQIPYIKLLSEALGIPMYEQKGYEADDLIGTLAHYGQTHKMQVVIVSGDKDFSQLINKNVTMYDTMKDLVTDEAKVLEKYGVPAEHFIDYLALTGDSSDNIPGVKGIGPKGAQKLIEEFHTIEGIYKNLGDIKNPKLKEKLAESKDMALLSKKLVTIETKMDVKAEPEDLKLKGFQKDKLEKLLDELEFASFKKNLLGIDGPVPTPSTKEPDEEDATPVPTKKVKIPSKIKAQKLEGKEFAAWLKDKDNLWVIDCQREYIFADENEIVTYSGSDESLRKMLDKDSVLSWSGYDLKACWRQLKLTEKQVAGWDSYLAAYVVHAGATASFAEVYTKYLGKSLPELADGEQLYHAQLELKAKLEEELQKTHMEAIPQTIEFPIIDILTAMETRGVLIDVDFLQKESKALGADIKKIEKAIHDEAGEEFNIASPKQLGHVLFDKMKIPTGKKTKTGYSTNTDVLEAVQDEFPIAKKIIQYRELTKLKSTYVDALPTLVNPETGRVHTTYSQALTATGRLSSINPNLQNIPIRTERGMKIRNAFIAAPKHVLVSADYSQIELRILAHISNDPGLKEAFANDIDIHAKTASEVFGVPLDKVDADMRRKAKAVNFGIAYGQGAFGLAEGLGIPRGEAKDIIDLYFQRFSGVKKYMTDVVKFVEENGYVESILGRRRYLPEIRSKNRQIKAFAERAAINAPIQGMSSDLVKLAMIEVAAEFRDAMILQVHDELIFELPDDKQLTKNMERIQKAMENCMQLDVPLKVNIASGSTWADI